MPWKQTCVMEQRVKFIMDFLEDSYSMTELCENYNISRKTGYKWLDRYNTDGIEALRNQSRAPRNHPNEMSGQMKDRILSIKKRFPKWGAPKIRARLERENPRWPGYPAISTIGLFLRRQGLTCPRKRRRKATPTALPLTNGHKCNQVWCADFKGHFKTSDGSRCNPLTISDHASRYLLCCRHVERMSYSLVKMRFERVFRQYGLPEVIRTDNGTPFSSRGLGGLSRLSYWWIRLDIYPERIEPGRPQQNGRHERMHKTLKAHTANPPAENIIAQQNRFNSFRTEYNEHRPHEALQMKTPSDCYSSSIRSFPSRLPQVSYPDHMQVRCVSDHGDIRYLGKRLFTTESLGGEYVGIERTDEDISLLWYCNYLLGRIDHRKWQIVPSKPACLSVQLAGQINNCNPGKVLPM